MPVDTEKEITKMHRMLHSTQNEIGKTYYRWRQVALEFAGDDVDPLDVSLRAAEIFGKDIGKSFLPSVRRSVLPFRRGKNRQARTQRYGARLPRVPLA